MARGLIDTSRPAAKSFAAADGGRRLARVVVLGLMILLPSVARAGGALDDGFDPGQGPSETVHAVAVQADGKVLVGGQFTQVSGQPRVGVARFNPDGSLDTYFRADTNGTVFTLKVQADGHILVGGGYSEIAGRARKGFARLNPDGSLDASFRSRADGIVKAVALSADGRVVAGGGFTQMGGRARNRVARLNADGTADGIYSHTLDGSIHAVVTQGDGSTLVGGDFLTIDGKPRQHFARLDAGGSPDESFGPDVNGAVNSVAVQLDDKILFGGAFDQVGGRQSPYLARLNADGSFDESFTDNGPNGEVYCIALQPDGRILIGGLFTKVAGQPRDHIARLNPDGSLDASFDPAGALDLSEYVASIALQSDGRVVVGGLFFPRNGGAEIARLNADGSLDTSFKCYASYAVLSVKVQADGRILMGGQFQQVNQQTVGSLTRLNPDGTIDPSFYHYGRKTNGTVETIATQANGEVWAGGNFSSVDYGFCDRVIRLGSDGVLNLCPSGIDGQVEAVTFRPDNRPLVGGSFSTLFGQPRQNVGRLANGEGASDYLTANLFGTGVNWLRGGGAPELDYVLFEISADGAHYSPLGAGRRIRGGWQLTGLTLPQRKPFFIRARGAYSTGRNNGSVALVQSVRSVFLNGAAGPSPSLEAAPPTDPDTQ